MIEIEKCELLLINGGNEYSYNKGNKVGEFFGKIGKMVDNFVEIFK